jgi:hypothetical protein
MALRSRALRSIRQSQRTAKKPAASFLTAGINSCDDANMPVICPTCQILSKPSK